jgi:hypothetical protein
MQTAETTLIMTHRGVWLTALSSLLSNEVGSL